MTVHYLELLKIKTVKNFLNKNLENLINNTVHLNVDHDLKIL